MAQNYERRHPHITLTNEQIQECIKAWQPHIAITDYQLITSGLANTNYIVTLANDTKVDLRIYSENSANIAQKEFKLSKLLTDIAEIPKMLYLNENSRITYSVMEFCHGITLDQINKDQNLEHVYFEIGSILPKLKQIKFASAGLLGNNLEIIPVTTKNTTHHAITNFILDCLENPNFLQKVPASIVASVKALILQSDAFLGSTDEDNHLVHGDLKIENIMVMQLSDEQWHLSGILDWEHARSDSSYSDIATLFRGDYIKDSPHKLAFYNGYTKSGATLIKDWDKAVKLIDLINICHFLCSTDDRPSLYTSMIEHLKRACDYCVKH